MASENGTAPATIKKDSFWLRHEFYRSRWKDWHGKWLEGSPPAVTEKKLHPDQSPKAFLGCRSFQALLSRQIDENFSGVSLLRTKLEAGHAPGNGCGDYSKPRG
jgi:hypothetical protein